MSTSEANTISTNSDIRRSLVREGEGGVGERASLLQQKNPQPPLLVPELIWNTIIISVAILVLVVLSKGETTEVPLRLWIVGFGVLRVFRMVCVCLQYWHWRLVWGDITTLDAVDNTWHSELGSVANSMQLTNTVLTVIWWIVGLYWMFSGGKTLAGDAPKLFWLTVIFLAIDLFVVLMCAFTSCIFCAVGCCCFQIIMTVLRRGVPPQQV